MAEAELREKLKYTYIDYGMALVVSGHKLDEYLDEALNIIESFHNQEVEGKRLKNKSFCGCMMCEYHTSAYQRVNPPVQQEKSKEEQAIELLGDEWEDFKEYVDGIHGWGMSDVERYQNR